MKAIECAASDNVLNPYQSPPEQTEVVESDPEQSMFERERSFAVPLLILSTVALFISLAGTPTAGFLHSHPVRLNGYLAYVLAIVVHLIQWFGARCMFAGRKRALSYFAAILCSIPLLSPLVVLGVPFGMMAIVALILGDAGVKGKRIPATLDS
ncbi:MULTISPECIES: hypothetical protein [Rhodopirellula]|jgi:hypothetical protein|uniref:hypothetical protein n=1 Tax=Rhodopirellula TaxID=265488 RepID=UPI00257BD636|nr:hypothetical protein [Rhodopirellula sp. UBA1907]|tara:strand:+ start:1659 stop:2120 length:462 start_codon:yes stop_codon:yes gene_type:complete